MSSVLPFLNLAGLLLGLSGYALWLRHLSLKRALVVRRRPSGRRPGYKGW